MACRSRLPIVPMGLGGLRLRLHERLRPEPCQTVETAPAPGVEPEMEPLAAFKGEVEPRFGGFTRLQLEIHQRSYFAKRFLKRLNSTRRATPPEKPEPEPFLEEPEPCQTGPICTQLWLVSNTSRTLSTIMVSQKVRSCDLASAKP
jgi:hypothetical protein